MPLIRIELSDFKSYRGHQVIGLFKYFTSVIGPNGAGKSNLMDAISFVLGGEGTAKKAWVLAAFQDEKRKEWLFQRIISTTGTPEYRLNNKVVTYSAYNTALTSHNILVKAKNSLVFQVLLRLSRLSLQESFRASLNRSQVLLSFLQEYEKAKEAREPCAIKSFSTLKRHSKQTRDIQTKSKALAGLRAEHGEYEKALDDVRAEQARACTADVQEEKKAKKAEKALEAKKIQEQVGNDAERQQAKLHSLRRDLSSARRAVDEAAEVYRRASRHNTSLSENSLAEYHSLKASVSVLAVSERQALEMLSRDEKTASRTITQLEDKLATLQGEHARSKQEYENQQSERTRISRLETETNEKLAYVYQRLIQAGVDRNESEREARLKETPASLQRIFPGERHLLCLRKSHCSHFTGVRGRVVDLCKPTQRKYETAVFTKKKLLLNYMRTQRAGQATFLPLDTISTKPINDKFRSFARGAHLAVDVIQYEPAVERAMIYACGNALVCDTMDVARYVCWERGQEVKAVTLEGTVIHKSGLITGGRSTHGGGKKWEEKDVQGLTRLRDNLVAQLQDLNCSKPRGKADENVIAEITRLESAIAVVGHCSMWCIECLQIPVQRFHKEELKHVERELKKLSPELKKAQASHSKLSPQITELQSAIQVVSAEDGVCLFLLPNRRGDSARYELFNKAYNHISDCVDQVYKDLTKVKASQMGGVAYLSLKDGKEPYNSGIKYHAMPPMK
ncbi:hypothetical protein P692DRAFT_201870696 [Suillus brevipes Sb2]|nr:hypothetical protein P692DRAFT_201870696 [Suillus brevipes Sb2]